MGPGFLVSWCLRVGSEDCVATRTARHDDGLETGRRASGLRRRRKSKESRAETGNREAEFRKEAPGLSVKPSIYLSIALFVFPPGTPHHRTLAYSRVEMTRESTFLVSRLDDDLRRTAR